MSFFTNTLYYICSLFNNLFYILRLNKIFRRNKNAESKNVNEQIKNITNEINKIDTKINSDEIISNENYINTKCINAIDESDIHSSDIDDE